MSILDDPQILAQLTSAQIAALRNYEMAKQLQADQDKAQALRAGMTQPYRPGLLGQLAQQATQTPGLSQLGGTSPVPPLWQHNPAPPPDQIFGNMLAAFSDLARYTRFTDDNDLDHISLQTVGDAIVMFAYADADTSAGVYPSAPFNRIPYLTKAGAKLAECLQHHRILNGFRLDMVCYPSVFPPGVGLATKMLDLPTGKYPTLISRLHFMATNVTSDDRVLNALAVIDTAASSEERRRIATRQLRQLTNNRPTFTKSDLLAIADESTHVLNLRSSTDRLLSSISSADDLLANAD